MNHKNYLPRNIKVTGYLICLIFFAFMSFVANAADKSEPKYEAPTTFKAADMVPADLLKGPHHTLDSKVNNDGYMNTYTLQSPFGQFKVVSTAMLRVRIHELDAIAAIEKVKASDEFGESLKASGEGLYKGAKALVTQPKETISGAVTGIGKLFQRAGDAASQPQTSDYEDEKYKSLIGFSKTKREYAKEYGVDVYSSNPVLQKSLDEIAWAGFGGGLSFSVATMAVPGGAGLAVSLTGGTKLLNDVIATTPPLDLRSMNRDKLVAMGLDATLIDLFLENPEYSPRHQTLLVGALEEMAKTKARKNYLKFAVHADNENTAFFKQRMAEMYAGYHQRVKPIERFVSVGKLVAARATSGNLVIGVPFDYLLFTRQTASIVTALNEFAASSADIKGKELWVTGKASPSMRKHLIDMGWTVHEGSGKTLLEKK
jgi:hypothetical protein